MVEQFVEVLRQGRLLDDIGGDFCGPAWLDIRATVPELVGVEVRARVAAVSGTYELVDVRVKGSVSAPVSSDALRQIPVRALIRAAVRPIILRLNRNKLASPGPLRRRTTRAEAEKAGVESRNWMVAYTYRLARVLGEPPTQAVQEAAGVSSATASRMVRAARDAGFLGEDEVGKGGGTRSRLERSGG